MKLTNKQYDIAKNIITIAIPAINVCIAALGGLYGFDTKVIIGTISALTACAGAILGVSSKNYQEDKE